MLTESEEVVRALLRELLVVTEELAGAIEAQDPEDMERLIGRREELMERVDAAAKSARPGMHGGLMREIQEKDDRNRRALVALMATYKGEIRRLKLSRRSVRLYTGTVVPPEAGYFDKKS